jgi:hypothetical protein
LKDPGQPYLFAKDPINEVLFLPLDLTLRQRPQRDNLQTARQGIRELRQREDIGRPREYKRPGLFVAINGHLDGQKDLRRSLNLVDDRHPAELIDEPGRIPLRIGERGDVIERHIVRLFAKVHQLSDERRLPRLPRTIDQNHAGMPNRLPDSLFDVSSEHRAPLSVREAGNVKAAWGEIPHAMGNLHSTTCAL